MFSNALKKLFSGRNSSQKKIRQSKKPKVDPSLSPEQLCGITSGMTPADIKDHLALLYRRHNHAASSLDESLRAESEIMLDAIVTCREKYLG
jgi:hypothetical protein